MNPVEWFMYTHRFQGALIVLAVAAFLIWALFAFITFDPWWWTDDVLGRAIAVLLWLFIGIIALAVYARWLADNDDDGVL